MGFSLDYLAAKGEAKGKSRVHTLRLALTRERPQLEKTKQKKNPQKTQLRNSQSLGVQGELTKQTGNQTTQRSVAYKQSTRDAECLCNRFYVLKHSTSP